ncbi:MAG: HU family DNA-binding protein [Candidatus Firestonebacteria bacterium]
MTVTKLDLVKKVIELGINGKVAKNTVQTFIDSIVNSLKKGDKVQISGFGTFIIRQKRERMGRNPKTGEKVLIPAKTVTAFKPSEMLKDLIEQEQA